MCACVSDSELVAFLRALHLWDSYCDQFRIKLVHEFGLLILLRADNTTEHNRQQLIITRSRALVSWVLAHVLFSGFYKVI